MPHIYLATPITSVSEQDRQIIVRWCHWYIQNKLPDKDVFCPAIEYDRRWANGPPQTEADLLAIRDRSWQMFEITDEFHVLHPDLSTNAAIEFGFAMGQKLEKIVVISIAEWRGKSLKDYTLRLLMHKPDVQFVSHSLIELGLASPDAANSSQGSIAKN